MHQKPQKGAAPQELGQHFNKCYKESKNRVVRDGGGGGQKSSLPQGSLEAPARPQQGKSLPCKGPVACGSVTMVCRGRPAPSIISGGIPLHLSHINAV